jgi:hypothetical protein
MEYFKSTSEIRSEVKNNYVYIRNLSDKGGVIDALLNDKTSKKISMILQQVTTESFSQVWDKMNKVKGVRFDFRAN